MVAVQLAETARLAPQVVPEIAKSAALAPLSATLLMVMDDPGPFDNVTVCAGLLAPSDVAANERLVGDAEALAGVTPPMPDSATTWGLPEAESAKFRLAVRVPAAVGLNTSVAEQLEPTDKLVPQVVPETTKSVAFAPVTVTPLMVIGEELPFVSMTDWDTALAPTAVLANPIVDGAAVTTPLMPRPESAIVWGLLPSESLKLRVAVRVPVAVGPNKMFAVQLVPGARVAPQVLLNTVKSGELAPLNVRPLMVMVLDPGFVSVTTFCPPLFPTTTEAQLRLAGDEVAARAGVTPKCAHAVKNPSIPTHIRLNRTAC